MQFPLQEPVVIFALAMIVFLLTPILMTKMKIPGIIGPILAGILIGPNGLNILERNDTIQLLGTVGLLFIIFIAGLELDIEGFKKYKHRSLVFGLMSFNIPLVIGTFVGLLVGFNWTASILLGSILGSHTLLGYPIASRLGITKNKAVTTAIGGTLITDIFAMIFLAVLAGAASGTLNITFWLTLSISSIIFVFTILFGTPFITRWFFRNSDNDGASEFNYVMTVLFLSGTLALFAGLQPIIGAFLAGLGLNRYIFQHGPLMNRIRFSANALFIPFFLLSVGMLMDLKVLISNPQAWVITILMIISVIFAKYLAAWGASKIYNYSQQEKQLMFGLTIPQAAATLASTIVGFQVGLLNQDTVNAVIIMILVTCVVGPYFVEKFGRNVAIVEEQDPSSYQDMPERILIPLSYPDKDTIENLLDLSFLLKQALKTDEPIYPLTVVQNDIKKAANEVAAAEKMLGHTLLYSSGADVPIRLLTRVDSNIGRGIERAVTEERITTIIAEWNGERSSSRRIFGKVIDNFIDHTYQRTLITKLDHPLSTTERIVLILPQGVKKKPGFSDAINLVASFASQISTTIVCVVVNEELEIYERTIRSAVQSVQMEFIKVSNWIELNTEYVNQLKKNDLVIVLSARRGTVAWHPELEAIPKRLATVIPESFIIFYPTERKEIDVRGARGTTLPKELLLRKDYGK